MYSDLLSKNIVIVESKAYYEAYCHVLQCIQKIEELPFASLIVYGRAEDNTIP